MKLALVLVVALGLVVPACSGNGSGGGCGPAPPTLATVPDAAKAFPTPAGLAIIGVERKAPTTEIIAAIDSDLGPALDAYQRALSGAGYLVATPQQSSGSARLDFSGKNATGTVSLLVECPGRTDVTVAITTAAGPA
ncbi:MAG: hypothetical protein M3Q23_13645 [Actinomycetota bacterium]|nr:hypothetical protein [Actinomycetota bacterium]